MVDDMLRTGEWRQFMIIPVANLAVAAVQGVAATRSLQRGMLLISDLTPCRGYKFRAGLIKASTGEEIELETEREIFAFLGLRYVPPELRNADG
jgi:DNA polymerase/3'-5' exonuclease PolX